MQSNYEDLLSQFPQIEQNKPLANLNTFRVGGNANLYFELRDIDLLPALINTVNKLEISYFVLGGGSNTIFADDGYHGLIIHLKAKEINVDDNIIVADAGALLSQVVQFSLKNGLSGMEKLMGLPGTIGGAVRGNAGAFGTETKDFFHKAFILNEDKKFQQVGPEHFQFDYRHSTVKKSRDIVLKVYLQLEQKDCKEELANAMDILKNRISKQPKGQCSGSFFKNPGEDLKAGYLLDKAGCKGLQVGKVQVSPEHANWLMNLGGATQKDILELCKIMQERVKQRFNVDLEREVQLVSLSGLIND